MFRSLRVAPICSPPTSLLLANCLVLLTVQCVLADPVRLTVATQPQQAAQAKVVFEVAGNLLATEPGQTEDQARKIPMKAVGQYLYLEQPLGGGLFLREYQQAEAQIEVQGTPSQSDLRKDRREIVVATQGASDDCFSPAGPLTRLELELLEVPAGSHLVDQLLPAEPQEIGATWTHDDQLLAQLFHLQSVTTNDVKSQIDKVDEKTAYLSLQGNLVGMVNDVLTSIELRGKYNFNRQLGRITWVAIAVKEQRKPGLAAPGLDVEARLRMVLDNSPKSIATDVAAIGQDPRLLEYRPEGRDFTVLHDRRWYVLDERPDLTVLRRVERGQFVAQCNIRTLKPAAEGSAMTLADFQKEVRTALGNAAETIVESREFVDDLGRRQLRLVVMGAVRETPIQWIYYHITNTDGRRQTWAFTLSGEEPERLDGQDLALISSLLFLDESGEPQTEAAGAETARGVEPGAVAR